MTNKKNLQRALLLSTSLPAAFMLSPAGQAREVTVPAPVAPATSVPGASVNAAIVTAITAPDDANLKLTVPSAAVVTGDSIQLNPAAGQGDGKIEFLNDGKIGAVDSSGAVTDAAGAIFNGRAAAGAANSFTATNNGLIAGGLRAVGFGGDVAITNGGAVHNGITASGQGNVSVTTAAAGAVRSGNVLATSNTVATPSAPVDGMTKTSVTGGTASIVQAGDAADAEDDSIRGNLGATGLNGADVTVSAKARNVTASAGGVIETVSGSNPVVSGTVTTTTTRSDVTRGGGAAKVTVNDKGDVASATAASVGGASVVIDGAVANNVNAGSTGANTSFTQVTAIDGATTVSDAIKFSSTAVGKTADVAIGQGGSVGGNVSVVGQGGATATVDGAVKGSVNLTSEATNEALESTLGSFSDGFTAAGGAATGTVGATGSIDGNLIAAGDTSVALSNAGTIKGNVSGRSNRSLTNSSSKSSSATSSSATLVEISSQSESVGRSTATTGTASFANAAGGQVQGSVTLAAGGDVTYTNAGTVFRATSLSSKGADTTTTTSGSTKTSTAIGVPPALDVVTTTIEGKSATTTASTGGNVTGTYAGVNGTANFGVFGDGSVTQVADQASKATVSGVIYGGLTSVAGSANSESSVESKSVEILSGGNGTRSLTGSSSFASTTNAGGDSTVIVNGKLTKGEAGVTPSLSSSATGNSSVTLSGAVDGDITSVASATDGGSSSAFSAVQTITSGVTRTDSLTRQDTLFDGKSVGGASTIDIGTTGKAASTSGNVYAYGRTGATVTVAKGGTVGSDGHAASVGAIADGADTSLKVEQSFTRDVTAGTATGSQKLTYNGVTNAGVGDATVAIGGAVSGSATSNTTRGTATTTVTGTVGGDASATAAYGTDFQYSQTDDYAGKVSASGSTSFGTLAPALSKSVVSISSKAVGGAASVLVDTASDLKKLDKTGVAGSVYATGVTSATATIAGGSKVGGDVEAYSHFTDATSASTTLYNSAGEATESQSNSTTTLSGGDAMVAIGAKSLIGGGVYAEGDKTAMVSNAGSVGGPVFADALHSVVSTTTNGMNLNNVGLRQEETTDVYTGVGGNASVTNAAGALIGGSVYVAGATGAVTNNGGIGGTVVLGHEVYNHSQTEVKTVTSTTRTVTPAAALTNQTYVLDQNNFLAGGVYVGGATITDPFGRADEPDLLTSNVKATVNLNNGSVTLGDIRGQRDAETGAFLTDTTLNLNGSGFLGTDRFNDKTPTSPAYLPEAVKSKEAIALEKSPFFNFYGNYNSVRILGVNSVNKADAGTFVLNLAAYDTGSPASLDRWSADVGSINVTGGELQIAGPTYDPTDPDGAYIGIKGDIMVDGGSLVFGRRTLVDGGIVGGSIASGGRETIEGVHVVLNGNYTQSATGTTVVGIGPSLVRSAPVTIGTVNGGAEVLGPIEAGANVPFFTTPANGSSAQSTPSRIDVTGKVTLAGKVLVDVTKDAIYSTGDGYTLLTYGDAGSAVSATVSQSISSPFVSFELKNDTATKTIQIAAKRAGYATVATNPNAVSAANALDALIPTLVKKIRDDANGGAVFTTVSEIGRVQDAANIVSGLDWRLSQAGAAQLFNELSSAEIYGSLAAIEQNSALTESFETASAVGLGKSGVGLWINPVGRFARYGGTSSGASKIRDNSYGGAIGLNLSYSNKGGFGIGFAYAEHDIAARGTPETAKAKTYSLGFNWKHSFGPLQAGAQFVYGFSNFNVARQLTILDRTATAAFKGRQWDGNVELGYDVLGGGAITVLPYGKLALRHWSLGGFTEQGGGGIGLTSGDDSKTVFVPELGVRLGTEWSNGGDIALRPFGKLSYTFQGDVGSGRSFTYAAGGSPFVLNGVDPKGYGSIDGGLSAVFKDRIGIFVQGGLNFGGSQKGAEVRGGVNVGF